MANPRTLAKLAKRIKERAAYCVEFELNDPRSAFITVTRVEVSSDLSHAKVYYSILGTEGERSRAKRMLEDAAGFIQRQVGRVLNTRRIPRITWRYDESIEETARLGRTIQAALERDRGINPEAHAELVETEPDEAETTRPAHDGQDLLERRADPGDGQD